MRITRIGRYAATTLLVAGASAPAAGAAGRPDLSVAAVSGPAGPLTIGAPLRATIRVRNTGPRRARRSSVALYLARAPKHAPGDVRLATTSVAALRPRGGARRTLRTTIPAAATPASYRLLACADSSGRVRERSERNNCRAATGTIVLAAAQAPAAASPIAVPAPAPAGAPPAPSARDADADGFPAGPDCDDGDAGTHPGATDAPDMTFVDSNCDGIDGDAARAVFVSPVGDDAASGTRAAPKRTLGAGLVAATDEGRDLYVSRGIYPELLVVRGGVGIYGGYDLDWTRSDANETRIVGSAASGAAVLALGVEAPTTLQLLTIAPGPPTASGVTAYGLKADHSPSLVLDHLVVTTPDGRAGRPGSAGARGADGRAGLAGGKGSCDGPYPGGGGGATGPRGGREGGEGGDGQSSYGDNDHTAGQAGAGVAGGAGGARGSSGDPGTAGAAGGNGGNGLFRGDGAGAGAGLLSGAEWSSPDGDPGLAGTDGSGGGGGGGGGRQHCTLCDDGSGNGGGEGGEGGAGGRGGLGGQGGGGSFGVFLSASPGVVINDSVIRAGQGGHGGPGGLGGFGGSGGARGQGSTACTSEVGAGGNGGVGGGGGRGGNGGGGAGGPSIAVFRGGHPVTLSGTTLSHAAAGAGGSGPGGAGAPGVAADVV